MSSVPSTHAPEAGACVQPDTGRVMMCARPNGDLAHLIPLTPKAVRELAGEGER